MLGMYKKEGTKTTKARRDAGTQAHEHVKHVDTQGI